MNLVTVSRLKNNNLSIDCPVKELTHYVLAVAPGVGWLTQAAPSVFIADAGPSVVAHLITTGFPKISKGCEYRSNSVKALPYFHHYIINLNT